MTLFARMRRLIDPLMPEIGPGDQSNLSPYHPLGAPVAREAMMALDGLPQKVRLAIYYSAARHDPIEVASRIKRDKLSENDATRLVMMTDALMLRQAAKEHSHG